MNLVQLIIKTVSYAHATSQSTASPTNNMDLYTATHMSNPVIVILVV